MSKKTNSDLRKKADKWAQENVHPASDQNRIWASEGFISGVEHKSMFAENERHDIHKAAFEAGRRHENEACAKELETMGLRVFSEHDQSLRHGSTMLSAFALLIRRRITNERAQLIESREE